MPRVICDNCGMSMDKTDEDSRQEWYEAVYHCNDCDKTKIYRQEYGQDGCIVHDDVYEE